MTAEEMIAELQKLDPKTVIMVPKVNKDLIFAWNSATTVRTTVGVEGAVYVEGDNSEDFVFHHKSGDFR